MRARAVCAATCAAVLVAGALALVGGQSAGAANAVAVGRYEPVTPSRVLDTRTGIGAARAHVASGAVVSFAVPSSVPSGATALLLNLTVTASTGAGYVTAYAAGTTPPGVSNLNYVRGQSVSNLASVPVSAARTISLYNNGATVDLLADLTGYVRTGASRTDAQRSPVQPLDGLGAFASVGPARVLDTRGHVGVATPAPAGGAVNVKVTGGSVPGDASAVLINLTAVTPVRAGYLTAYPALGSKPNAAARPTTSSLTFPAGRTVPGLALVPVGDGGAITLFNGSGAPLQLLGDIQGYVAGGQPASEGAFGTLAPQRLLDTRSTAPVAANTTIAVATTGVGGVPRTNVSAVAVTVTATGSTAPGYLTVYGATATATSSVNFTTGQTVSNVVLATPDAGGRITVRNGSPGRTQVLVDVVGYVSSADVDVPTTTVSRYTSSPAKIAGTGNSSEGCVDGASGATLVLLDVGAQSRTGPELSKTNPGVALARTNPVVRRTYAELVADLTVYLSEFARCGDQQARIAIGANTSGAYSGANAYPAYTRGIEWATKVVQPLQKAVAGSSLSVLGANDIEAGFAGAEADAEAWITNFLGQSPSLKLIYNGSLDNCSDNYARPLSCGPVADENGVAKTWTPAQYVKLTYGLAPGRISVLPQIYYSVPSQAAQWRNLYVASGAKLTFEGSLTQYAVLNSAAAGYDGGQGWAALHQALATVANPPALPVATDLRPT